MKTLIVILLATLLPSVGYSFGLAIHTTLDSCSVQSNEEVCEPAPYPATITLTDLRNRRTITFNTGPEGYAHIRLAPGEYLLTPSVIGAPVPGAGIQGPVWPRATPVLVRVVARQITVVEIVFDAGVR